MHYQSLLFFSLLLLSSSVHMSGVGDTSPEAVLFCIAEGKTPWGALGISKELQSLVFKRARELDSVPVGYCSPELDGTNDIVSMVLDSVAQYIKDGGPLYALCPELQGAGLEHYRATNPDGLGLRKAD